jgi:hypothetical protein
MSARDQLDSYLKQLEKRLRLSLLLRGAAILILVALTATLILVVAVNAFAFSAWSVSSARVVLLMALIVAASVGLALPLYALTTHKAALRAESVFPRFQQRLVTFAERPPDAREPFIELLAADTLQVSREARPTRLVSDGKLMVSFSIGLTCLVLLVWIVAAGPGYLGYGAARLWRGSSHGAALYDIRVSPGDATIRRNGRQLITAQLIGMQADKVSLHARYLSASKWEESRMQPQPGASGFQFLFAGVPENVEYYVEAGRLHSRHFNIRVVDLPSIKQIHVTYHFPGWTGLPSATEEHGGDLRAVEGTEAELAILTDRPVRDGVLVLDNQKQVPLSGGEGNVYRGAIRIEKDGIYHVAGLDQGQNVRLSDDFFIESRKPNPPEVRITRSGRDYRASPIEEVSVAVKADDEYGLNNVSLHYSVNAGPEQTIQMLRRKGAKEADGSALISLEKFKLVPGDLLSLYASAKDARSESRTDMFFIQAEPFEREYSQSQLDGGGGGGQLGDQDQISQRQKEIIAATWKQRSDKKATRQEMSETGKFLSGVQAKLRGQALSLAGRLASRELTEENEEFNSFQQDMKAAAEAMDPAAERLQQQKWTEAIPHEQKALQRLLRAEATFRRIEVAFGNQRGGGGAGAGRDLASLFDLELDTEKNQYETGQTAATANQRSQEIDRALQKLEELARRQQELAEQQRNASGRGLEQRWQQERLRREAEQLQREMEQLTRGNQQGSSSPGGQTGEGQSGAAAQSLQQALNRLRQASDDLRRAASSQQSKADARRAADRLEEAANLLGGMRQQQPSGRLDSLAREADRLGSEQRAQSDRLRQMFAGQGRETSDLQSPSGAGKQDRATLAEDRQRVADGVSRLDREMREAERELASSERAAASKLRTALSGMDQSGLQSRLESSADSIRRGLDPNSHSNSTEPAITAGMQRLGEQLHQAQQALGAARQSSEEALERVARLRSRMENLAHNLGQRHGVPSQPRQQSQGTQQNGTAGAGSYGTDSLDREARLGGVGPGASIQSPGIEAPGVGAPPGSSASIDLALRQALRELSALRPDVRGEPGTLAGTEKLIRELQRLGPGWFQGNRALAEQLSTQVLSNVDKLELQLRRELDDKQQIHAGDSFRVPPGYQDSVAEYFRRLSKAR